MRLAGFVSLLVLAAVLRTAAAAGLPDHPVMTYHESWWEAPGGTGAALSLAAIPPSVDIVALAFAKPDLRYGGQLDLRQTGLEYRATGPEVRAAIAQLRRGNPSVRVLLSVGGAAYTGWDKLDVPALVRLSADLGVDGLDVDFEPPAPDCQRGPACKSDGDWQAIIRRLRAAVPRPALLTVSAWSVGAYGQGRWSAASPPSPWTGSMVNLLRAPEAGLIDLVSIAAYGAGPTYDPAEAFAAYRSLWRGPLLLGMEGPPASGGGPPATAAVAARIAGLAAGDRSGGVMVYSWLGRPADGAAPAGRPLVQAACAALHRRC